jgi:hypothetical protein
MILLWWFRHQRFKFHSRLVGGSIWVLVSTENSWVFHLVIFRAGSFLEAQASSSFGIWLSVWTLHLSGGWYLEVKMKSPWRNMWATWVKCQRILLFLHHGVGDDLSKMFLSKQKVLLGSKQFITRLHVRWEHSSFWERVICFLFVCLFFFIFYCFFCLYGFSRLSAPLLARFISDRASSF